MTFFNTDYLDRADAGSLSRQAIGELRRQCNAAEDAAGEVYRRALENCPEIPGPIVRDCRGGQVSVQSALPLESSTRTSIAASLRAFVPWKKGPFQIFDWAIDSEWRSDLKWQRLEDKIEPLAGRKIADVGCANGYFMYRMSSHEPELVVGFEPALKCYYNFLLLQRFMQVPRLYFERLGMEHLHLYSGFFDTVFCLGILYHHTDPVGLLRKALTSLRKGGQIVIDCQGIPGDDPMALCPANRYGRARGFWFLPTESCLRNWIQRAGFRDVEIIFNEKLSVEEQRTTEWAPIPSLKDALNPDDPRFTVEGYPAPYRIYATARK